jgi:hypothetical protein
MRQLKKLGAPGLLSAILNPSEPMIAVTIEKENIDESQT